MEWSCWRLEKDASMFMPSLPLQAIRFTRAMLINQGVSTSYSPEGELTKN
jgi:hypothetical protein